MPAIKGRLWHALIKAGRRYAGMINGVSSAYPFISFYFKSVRQ